MDLQFYTLNPIQLFKKLLKRTKHKVEGSPRPPTFSARSESQERRPFLAEKEEDSGGGARGAKGEARRGAELRPGAGSRGNPPRAWLDFGVPCPCFSLPPSRWCVHWLLCSCLPLDVSRPWCVFVSHGSPCPRSWCLTRMASGPDTMSHGVRMRHGVLRGYVSCHIVQIIGGQSTVFWEVIDACRFSPLL